MPPPHVTSLRDFQDRTRHKSTGFVKSRGRLRQIDHALEAWYAVANGTDDAMKLAAAYALVKECKRWILVKQREINEGRGKDSTESRMQQVEILAQEATVALMTYVDALGLSRAYDRFEGRKFNFGPRGGAQSLQGVYRHERTLYVGSGKQRAPSGTLLDHQYRTLSRKVGGTSFQNLSLYQYQKLDKLTKGKLDVLYLNKIQRLKYMAFVVNGLLCDHEDRPMTTRAGLGEPYAMDRYGNLFLAEDMFSHEEQFNHSTFNSGREVICAGCLKIKDGVLKKIDNSSGHYKPTVRHLHDLITVLYDEGLDLSQTTVAVVITGGIELMLHEYQALDFLHDPETTNFRVI